MAGDGVSERVQLACTSFELQQRDPGSTAKEIDGIPGSRQTATSEDEGAVASTLAYSEMGPACSRMEPRGRERHRWASRRPKRAGANESILSGLAGRLVRPHLLSSSVF